MFCKKKTFCQLSLSSSALFRSLRNKKSWNNNERKKTPQFLKKRSKIERQGFRSWRAWDFKSRLDFQTLKRDLILLDVKWPPKFCQLSTKFLWKKERIQKEDTNWKKNQWQYYGVNVRWNRTVTAVAVVVESHPSMVEITTKILEFQANIYS